MKNNNKENKNPLIATTKFRRHITDIWMIIANK